MRPLLAPLAALALPVAAACVSTRPVIATAVTLHDNTERLSPAEFYSDSEEETKAKWVAEAALELQGLQTQAAHDLACDPSVMTVLQGSARCAALVEGCGKRDVFLRLHSLDQTSEEPGLDGRTAIIDTVRFVPIEADIDAAKAELLHGLPPDEKDHFVQICFQGERQGRFLRLVFLNVRGAQDLHCARNEVYPYFVGVENPTPVAEGCGKRATYLPVENGTPQDATDFRLSAVIDLARP